MRYVFIILTIICLSLPKIYTQEKIEQAKGNYVLFHGQKLSWTLKNGTKIKWNGNNHDRITVALKKWLTKSKKRKNSPYMR